MRPVQTWILFGLCLAVVAAAMGGVSLTVLRLERAQAAAQRQAALEENVRLALWRLDSALAPLLAEERARPYFAYTSFYPAERAYTRMFAEIERGEVLMPSPVLMHPSPQLLVHFQFGPTGDLTSPQVPRGNMRDLAEARYVGQERIETAARHLAEVGRLIGREALIARLPLGRSENTQVAVLTPVEGPQAGQQGVQPGESGDDTGRSVPRPVSSRRAAGEPEKDPAGQVRPGHTSDRTPGGLSPDLRPGAQTGGQSAQREQALLNTLEWQQRLRYQYDIQQKAAAKAAPLAADVNEGEMKALWIGEALVLARRVLVNGEEYVQGCRLDWPATREALLDEVRDLLPEADLVPVADEAPADPGRTIAGAPIRLIPGALPQPPARGLTPIRVSLIIAWACVVVAATAVAVLLRGAVTLSERRGAFVSAVTHELRTPLTTFGMYTEMLSDGMVPDERRGAYLETLRLEAGRLAHLVENVLAYARLERRRPRRQAQRVAVRDLVEAVRPRLAERAKQGGMVFVVETEDESRDSMGCLSPPSPHPSPNGRGSKGQGSPGMLSPDSSVRADVSAVEQILFNLVDNACKYAAAAADRRIHLRVGRAGGGAALRVCDHGPGVARTQARRLFRPFSKSAREAAHSVPGVGLGLALSRRLARELGGDLTYEGRADGGACFVLTLPGDA